MENAENNQQSIELLDSLIKPLNTDKNLDSDIKTCMEHSFKNILLNYSKRNVNDFQNIFNQQQTNSYLFASI